MCTYEYNIDVWSPFYIKGARICLCTSVMGRKCFKCSDQFDVGWLPQINISRYPLIANKFAHLCE